ncbi:hypothetical protein [Vibrio phage RYC]|nr:hypothetical protein [Vibrio phage RYC]
MLDILWTLWLVAASVVTLMSSAGFVLPVFTGRMAKTIIKEREKRTKDTNSLQFFSEKYGEVYEEGSYTAKVAVSVGLVVILFAINFFLWWTRLDYNYNVVYDITKGNTFKL